MNRFLLLGAAGCTALALLPALAGPTALQPTVVASSASNVSRTFGVYGPSGSLLRTQTYRLTNAGGNCCEVQLGVTPAGRILEFGGDYLFFSDDRGVTWKHVRSLVPITGGEGSVSAAPGGDIVAVTWSPYVADQVTAYKYTASTGQWLTDTINLHTPFFDRPWISVVKGPVTTPTGDTAPYLVVMHGGWPNKDVEYVSYDGLSYVLPDARSVTAFTAGSRPPVVADSELDVIQGPAAAEVTSVGGGAAVRTVRNTNANGCGAGILGMLPASNRWYCVTNMGGTQNNGVLRADSNGWLHQVAISGSTASVRTSTNGGATWSTATATLPAGVTYDLGYGSMDVKTDGVRKRLYIGARLTDGSGQQDTVLRFDYVGGVPSYTERWEVGYGDLTIASSLSTAQRMDFTSLVVLPDGKVVTTFSDSTTGGSPAMAIQL